MQHGPRWIRFGVFVLVLVGGLGAAAIGCSSDSATQPDDPIVNRPPEPPGQPNDRDTDLDHAPDGADLFD